MPRAGHTASRFLTPQGMGWGAQGLCSYLWISSAAGGPSPGPLVGLGRHGEGGGQASSAGGGLRPSASSGACSPWKQPCSRGGQATPASSSRILPMGNWKRVAEPRGEQSGVPAGGAERHSEGLLRVELPWLSREDSLLRPQ